MLMILFKHMCQAKTASRRYYLGDIEHFSKSGTRCLRLTKVSFVPGFQLSYTV